MDNNQSSMDSQQPQLTSIEDSRQLPATTDGMAVNITNHNHIQSGSTQNIYHNCNVNIPAPARADPKGLPNDQSSQSDEEEVDSNIEFDDCHRVILPQAMFAKFSGKKGNNDGDSGEKKKNSGEKEKNQPSKAQLNAAEQ